MNSRRSSAFVRAIVAIVAAALLPCGTLRAANFGAGDRADFRDKPFSATNDYPAVLARPTK